MSNINSQTQRLTNNSDAHECSNHRESLFTSLSPEAAALVVGGGVKSFGFNTRFDFFFRTGIFRVRRGGDIALASRTLSTPRNRKFNASIFNVDTGVTSSQIVDVGSDSNVWRGVRGGRYRIILSDSWDNQYVSGSFGVGYTS